MGETDQLRVIVVEDDVILREALVSWLEGCDVCVIAEAGTASDAIELCLGSEADALLLDYRLLTSNGLEVVKAVRDAGVDLRIVMFSAFHDQSLKSASLAAGVDAFVSKGSDPSSVLRALRGD
jgi:two-component system nitrate/nitrite response regulator NarL